MSPNIMKVIPLRRARLCINGDDNLFPVPRDESLRKRIEKVINIFGFISSPGKCFEHEFYANVNSTGFWVTDLGIVDGYHRRRILQYEQIPFINFGLFEGKKRSSASFDEKEDYVGVLMDTYSMVGSVHQELIDGCHPSMREIVRKAWITRFLRYAKEKAEEEKKTGFRLWADLLSIAFYLSRKDGGLGLVGTPSRYDVQMVLAYRSRGLVPPLPQAGVTSKIHRRVQKRFSSCRVVKLKKDVTQAMTDLHVRFYSHAVVNEVLSSVKRKLHPDSLYSKSKEYEHLNEMANQAKQAEPPRGAWACAWAIRELKDCLDVFELIDRDELKCRSERRPIRSLATFWRKCRRWTTLPAFRPLKEEEQTVELYLPNLGEDRFDYMFYDEEEVSDHSTYSLPPLCDIGLSYCNSDLMLTDLFLFPLPAAQAPLLKRRFKSAVQSLKPLLPHRGMRVAGL